MGQRLRNFIRGDRGEVGAAFRFCTRFIDLLLVPFLLDAFVLYAYLAARAGTLSMPLALTILARKATPQLTALARLDAQSPFQVAAARINLGYLMICGGVAVFVLAAAPLVTRAFDGLHPSFDEILLWLVIGQSAPVLFGATGLLMHVVDRGAFYDLLRGMTALLFVIGVAALGVSSGVQVAQTLAAAQLTQAALCALLLTQCGVWPGLTALFQKQIKIF